MYSKDLGYFLALDSQPCLIWKILRGPLLRVPLKYFVQASCSRFTAWFPWGYLLLLLVFFLLVRWSGGFMPGPYRPLFPVYRGGYTNFSDWLPCNCKRCSRKSCPYLLKLSSCDEEGLIGFSSLLSGGLF